MELPGLFPAVPMSRRFFIDPSAVGNDAITVTGDLFRHISTVLRLPTGSELVLADGTGREYAGRIAAISRNQIVITIDEVLTAPAENPPFRITLFQALPKGEKLDLILQKSVELGVGNVVVFPSGRSIPRIAGSEGAKLERWQRIVREAARQSGCRTIPEVAFLPGLSQVLSRADHPLKLLLWEKETASLRETLAESGRPDRMALLVGPEGGFTDEEARSAVARGFRSVSLGPRILRTETAGLAMLSILQFHWGDLG